MLTLHLQIIGLSYIEQIVALADLEIMSVAVFVDEGNVELLAWSGFIQMSVLVDSGVAQLPPCQRQILYAPADLLFLGLDLFLVLSCWV